MIITILSLILFAIFLILGGFHIYWLLGGKWGVDQVIPRRADQEEFIPIPKFATLIVALGLFVLGMTYLGKSQLDIISFPEWATTYGGWIIPSIFTMRAIGDFNYVGVFKKIKGTEFAKADSKIFVPLCFCIGLMGFLIQMLQ